MPLVLEGLRGRKPQTQCWKKIHYYTTATTTTKLLRLGRRRLLLPGCRGGHEDLGVGIHGVQGLGASGGLRVFSI